MPVSLSYPRVYPGVEVSRENFQQYLSENSGEKELPIVPNDIFGHSVNREIPIWGPPNDRGAKTMEAKYRVDRFSTAEIVKISMEAPNRGICETDIDKTNKNSFWESSYNEKHRIQSATAYLFEEARKNNLEIPKTNEDAFPNNRDYKAMQVEDLKGAIWKCYTRPPSNSTTVITCISPKHELYSALRTK
jgi:hypothetical protein